MIVLAVMLDQAQQKIKRSKNAALAAASKPSADRTCDTSDQGQPEVALIG